MKRSTLFVFLLFLGGLLALARPGAALAQDPTPVIPDDAVNAIAKDMYCPVCENVPLDVCGTQACHQWRELIRQRLAEGWTETQIKNYFVEQYGDRVLAEPPAKGFNWLVYIVPPAIILLGIAIFVRWRRSAVPIETGAGPDQDVDPAYIARLEEELRKRG